MNTELALTSPPQQNLPAESEPAQDFTPAIVPDAKTNRIDEVSEALLPAYQKASELKLTSEEAKLLREPFPDEEIEIRPFDGLIYIPHITISDRLTDVLGPGQWSMVRRREWMEGERIYGEFVMKIRGCYIGESVGSMEYHPNNPKMNYADALEGTRGEALRRIAGKDLGCGSQVWKPSFCRRWVAEHGEKVWCADPQGKKKPMWRRKTDPPIDMWPWKEETRGWSKTSPEPSEPSGGHQDSPRASKPRQNAPSATAKGTTAPFKSKAMLLKLLEPNRKYAVQLLIEQEILRPDQGLNDWAEADLPQNADQLNSLLAAINRIKEQEEGEQP